MQSSAGVPLQKSEPQTMMLILKLLLGLAIIILVMLLVFVPTVLAIVVLDWWIDRYKDAHEKKNDPTLIIPDIRRGT